jgi:hypothetical protein
MPPTVVQFHAVNINQSQTAASAEGSVRRWVLIGISLIGIIVIGLIVQHRTIKNRADAGVAALKAKGLPVNLAELDLSYSVPPGSTNAADFYNQAFGALISYDRSLTNAPTHHEVKLGAPYATGMLPFLKQWIATNQPTLKLLRDGERHPACRYPQNYNAGIYTLLPHLAKLKSCVQLLSWDAVLRAEAGDLDGAIRSLETAFALSDSLINAPDIIGHVVRTAGHAIVNIRLEEMMNRHSFSDAQLVRLGRLFEGRETPGNLRVAFSGELCTGLDVFTNPQSAQAAVSGGTTGESIAIAGLKVAGFWERDREFFVDVYAGYFKAVALPFPEALEKAEFIDTKVESNPGGLRRYISRMLLYAIGRVIEKEARRVAMLRMTQTAIAIERYRLANGGALPETLELLAPEFLPSILHDPFDGQPLRYRQLDKGYIVYSLGPDKEDNEGDLEPDESQPKDERFRIFR